MAVTPAHLTDWTTNRRDLQGWAIAESERRRALTAMRHAAAEAARCAPGAMRYVREHGPTSVVFATGETATVTILEHMIVRGPHGNERPLGLVLDREQPR